MNIIQREREVCGGSLMAQSSTVREGNSFQHGSLLLYFILATTAL